MARDLSEAAEQFAELAANLRWAGETGLRDELYKAIDEAAQPLVAEIGRVGHLRAYMPDRYADVLAGDLRVRTFKRTTGPQTGVTLFADAPTAGRGGRKVRQRDEGRLTHPLFGDRQRWFTQAIVPGFFTAPAEGSAPYVREKIVEAVDRVEQEITRR